jgi:hypothetical protein
MRKFIVIITITTVTAVIGNIGSEEKRKQILGIPVITHVEDHYMLVIGYDDTTSPLYVNDPSHWERIAIDYKTFQNRFNTWRPRKPHNLGWDGRFLAVWE